MSNVAKSHPNMASLLTEEKQTINSLIRGERSIQKKRRTRETVKYALTGEDFPNVDDIVLVKVLHPLYVCLGIFGMIWKGKQKLFHRKICSFDLCTLHCVILLGMSWCHAFQFFASYEKSDVFGSVLFQKIGIHVFSFQMACGLTSFVFFHYKHIPNFIKLWENYKIRYGGVLPISVKKTLAVRCIWINIFTIGFIAFVKGYMFIKDKRLFARHNLPLLAYILDEPELWLLIVCGILNFYLTMAWIQSLISILCITKALHDEFLQLSLDLRERLHEGNSQSKKFQIWKPAGKNNKYQIEMYRQRHLELCKLVQVYDDSASCYLLFLYLFSIPVLVLIMYILWGLDKESYTEDLNQFVLSIVSLVFFVVILISVTVAVTSLNTAAKKPKDMLHSIDLATCANEEGISIQVFLQKLVHEHLGFSIWKFINIDKTVLLTMFTIVVSYLTLMLRFAIALSSTTILMNVTLEKCPCLNKTSIHEKIT